MKDQQCSPIQEWIVKLDAINLVFKNDTTNLLLKHNKSIRIFMHLSKSVILYLNDEKKAFVLTRKISSDFFER